MNSGKLFNKVFEQSRENVLMNKMSSTLSTDSPLLSQIHTTALCNPTYSVEQVLKVNNASYNQYSNLIKSGFSIPQIRKLQLGKTRELTGMQKESATLRLKKKPGKERKDTNNNSKGRKNYVGQGQDDTSGDNYKEVIDSEDDARLRKMYGLK